MNEQMNTTPLLPEATYQPTLQHEQPIEPIYYERRITFTPNVYSSSANYAPEAFAPVIGEVATKVVASVAPVEGTYHAATAQDMHAAYEAYANNGVSPEVEAAQIAAHVQQEADFAAWMSELSNTDDEESEDRQLIRA